MAEEDDDAGRLALVAVVPTLELARLRRRVKFLEAALVQVLREDGHLREWFGAAELATLRLPGLPTTRQGIGRLAKAQGWEARIVTGARGGERLEYHFTSLPRRAFEALIALVMREGSPAGERAPAALPELPEPEPPPAAPPAVATPQWVLPLLRMLRGSALPLEDAVRALPAALPAGAACPDLAEARAMLRAMGMG
jgi:hypothetical protein